MPPVLDAQALADSPLADLYLLANELGIDGYRRLRKADLVAAIITRQGGEPPAPEAAPDAESTESAPAEAEGRGGEDADTETATEGAADDENGDAGEEPGAEGEEETGRRRRSRRGGRGRRSREEAGDEAAPEVAAATEPEESGAVADGIVELLPNGSGFLRVTGDENAGDVYISAAQVKRCELVAGDRVTGPLRKPRNSERYPSLVRVDTINGRPADEVAEG
ncbi:MAG: Transcription termination factor Rho, partial [uncultured Solirubrobacteraceae bacterium]